ncbi:MAG: hypothetical protein AAF721_17015 [Myxococcota bacterium]
MSVLNSLTQHPRVKGWFDGEGLPRRVHLVVGLLIPLTMLAWQMWVVRMYTVDDAYISFRYARNLAAGHGLVYNLGEAVEGYTNFSLTVILGAGMAVGIDPHPLSKVLGAAAALGTLVVVYRLSNRLLPLTGLPCVATWLLATSAPFSNWSVFGLETTIFAFLVLLGTLLMFRETEAGKGFVGSALVFAAAGLTRPEAPMYLGLPMLLLGRRFVSAQNLKRGLLFAAPLLAHMIWRKAYYGSWVPSTLGAKTGDMALQIKRGTSYLGGWLDHAGPAVWLALYGAGLAVAKRSLEFGALALVSVCGLVYVLLVGGDWMSYSRFVVPIEPYIFVLAGVTVRTIVETRDRAALVALLIFAVWVGNARQVTMQKSHKQFRNERRHWNISAGRVADWIRGNLPKGRVALGDIGFVGYRTNYPILDLLGLVDPVIHELPGGYTKKVGDGYLERFYEVSPEHAVLIMTNDECRRPALPGVRVLTEDPRFSRYRPVHAVTMASDVTWCIFTRR